MCVCVCVCVHGHVQGVCVCVCARTCAGCVCVCVCVCKDMCRVCEYATKNKMAENVRVKEFVVKQHKALYFLLQYPKKKRVSIPRRHKDGH